MWEWILESLAQFFGSLLSIAVAVGLISTFFRKYAESVFVKRYRRDQLIGLIKYVHEQCSNQPKRMEENYSNLIFLKEKPNFLKDSPNSDRLTIISRSIHPIDTLRKRHEESFSLFTNDQNNLLFALFDRIENYNTLQPELKPDVSSMEVALQMLLDICFISFYAEKIEGEGKDFQPGRPIASRETPAELNKFIREKLNISIKPHDLLLDAMKRLEGREIIKGEDQSQNKSKGD
ncbi:hypothetical protein [Microbulbifer sp. DLAB2-AA]|uniref:hypothetical protein n=1 Tax=Microbulbifer sp. DLAB2-AA TaxID=3243394 RepID=UPI004039D9D6